MYWPELDTLPGRPGMVLQKTHQIDVMIGSSSYSQYIELILIGEKKMCLLMLTDLNWCSLKLSVVN
jgi:hypothetical protein